MRDLAPPEGFASDPVRRLVRLMDEGHLERRGGRDAILEQKENRSFMRKRLVQFLLQDPEVVFYHHEPILRDGVIVGHLTSGDYGHTLGAAVGLGYVEVEEEVSKEYIEAGNFEIDVAGERIPATASLSALYDPKAERMRG